MATYDELDDIRQQASQNRMLREGVNGSGADNAELQQRLRANPQPATPSPGELRGQVRGYSPAETAPSPMARVANVAPVSESINDLRNPQPRPALADVDARLRPQLNMNAEGQVQSTGRPSTGQSMGELRDQVLKRTPQATAAAAPSVAAEAGEAVKTAAKSGALGRLGRAVPIVGTAAGVAGEALNVNEVARNPNATSNDVATQTMEGVARLAGGAVGGIAGGMTLGPVGAVGGAVAGYKIADEGIKQLRSMVGLDPQSPVDRLAPKPQPAAATGVQPAGQPTANQPVNRPVASDKPAASAPAPRTMAAAAQQKPPEPKYVLGENAVEVIRPGGNRTVETFGENGNEGAVPSEIFNQGRTGEYRRTMSDAAMTNMTDPNRHIAVQKLANEGGVERERMQQEGETGRNTARINAPQLIQPRPNPAAGLPGQSPVIDGAVFDPTNRSVTPLNMGKPTPQQRAAQASAAVAAGAKPEVVGAQLGASFRFDPKSKTFIEVSAPKQ